MPNVYDEDKWDAEWGAALKEAASDTDHFYGAWNAGSGGGGGRAMPRTPSQMRAASRLTVKAENVLSDDRKMHLAVAASFINRQARQFTNAGGVVRDLTDGGRDEAKSALDETLRRLDSAHDRSDYEASLQAFETGPRFARLALMGGTNGDADRGRTYVAYGANGEVAGAMFIKEGLPSYPLRMRSPSQPQGQHVPFKTVELDIIGTTGILPGAGSALMKKALLEYGPKNVGVTGEAVSNAMPWWNRISGSAIPVRQPDERTFYGMYPTGLPPAEVTYLASRIEHQA